MSISGHVVFSHGLDGTPFSTKIRALYEIAEAEGFDVAAVDLSRCGRPRARADVEEFCADFAGPWCWQVPALRLYPGAAPTLHAKGCS